MPTCTAPDPARPVREYGCTRCQKWHREGLDAEYEPHLYWQSKHGPMERPATPAEVLGRIVQAPEGV